MTDYKPGYEYECAYCGKDNELSYYRDDEPQYCGNECAHKARSEEARFDVECSFCGRPTTVDKYAYERNEHHYCDRKCWRESQKTGIKVHCEVCGKEEFVTPTREKSYRTCSKECISELQSDEFSGEGNPNHNSDISNEEIQELYEEGQSSIEIGHRLGVSYGTVVERLEKLDVDRRDPGYPKEVETSFGLMVRSSYEKAVAEALHDNGIEFEYEPSFPGPYLPDFVLSDGSVMEVWGVEGDEYNERRKQKMSWYKNNGYNVISVYPDDVDQLEKKMPYNP